MVDLQINFAEKIEPGCHHFICRDCGFEIFWYGDPPTEPLCSTCRWLADHPDAPQSVKDMLRGEG